MLRANVRQGTELGRQAKAHMDSGGLVPDDLIVAMAASGSSRTMPRDGFILDGFPRTTAQAEALDEQLAELGRRVTAALLIDVPDEEVVERISGPARVRARTATTTTSSSIRPSRRESATRTARG